MFEDGVLNPPAVQGCNWSGRGAQCTVGGWNEHTELDVTACPNVRYNVLDLTRILMLKARLEWRPSHITQFLHVFIHILWFDSCITLLLFYQHASSLFPSLTYFHSWHHLLLLSLLLLLSPNVCRFSPKVGELLTCHRLGARWWTLMPSSCAGAAQGGVQNGAKGSVQGLGKSSSSCSLPPPPPASSSSPSSPPPPSSSSLSRKIAC